MSSQTIPNPQDDAVTAEMVADYLKTHADFFVTHEALLAELSIPHPCGAAVSLLERQAEILRSQNQQFKNQLRELVQVGRDNERLNQRMHQLSMALVEADDFQQVITALDEQLHQEFNADAVRLGVPQPTADQVDLPALAHVLDYSHAALEAFQKAFKSGRPVCGALQPEQLELLFGDRGAGIASAALVPLGEKAAGGLLAIGSTDANRFHEHMDTLFLRNLGELTQRALQQHPLPTAR